jgi:hypothetical protein
MIGQLQYGDGEHGEGVASRRAIAIDNMLSTFYCMGHDNMLSSFAPSRNATRWPGGRAMKKTHTGSCHCGAVRYEADFDLAEGTGKCNCTICAKKRQWGVIVKPDAFRLISGADNLTVYRRSPESLVTHPFCKTCGISCFGEGNIPEIGGAYYSVFVATLDNVTAAELIEAPVTYFDGRNNNWWNPPADTRHL